MYCFSGTSSEDGYVGVSRKAHYLGRYSAGSLDSDGGRKWSSQDSTLIKASLGQAASGETQDHFHQNLETDSNSGIVGSKTRDLVSTVNPMGQNFGSQTSQLGPVDSSTSFESLSTPRLDVNSLILQTIHFMDSEIDRDLLDVVFDLESELPTTWADADQMRQVLLNIIRNAMQEMKDGGSLSICTQLNHSEITIKIKDTGPGIPEEIREKVFDAFFTTKSTGSGLGLAICSQLVRNHSGRFDRYGSPRGCWQTDIYPRSWPQDCRADTHRAEGQTPSRHKSRSGDDLGQ